MPEPVKISNTLPVRLAWFAGLWAFVFLLKAVGDFYPFSDFPMYSGFGEYADVLFVETESGERLPVLTVFGKRESRCKKIWKSKLREVANAEGRHSEDATEDDLRVAGEYLLGRLLAERYQGRLEPYGTRELRLVQRRIRLEPSGELVESESTIASMAVDAPAPAIPDAGGDEPGAGEPEPEGEGRDPS